MAGTRRETGEEAAALEAEEEAALEAEEAAALEAAVRHVERGGLVAYPTETVWGLGADARSAEAVAALRRWKGRDEGHPLSILVPDLAAAEALGLAVPAVARALAARFWPGPLTLVLPAPAGRFAPGVARPDGAVGLRCSPARAARRLAAALARAGVGPVTATSLNRSGEPPARTRAEAQALCAAHPGPRLLALAEEPVSCAAPSTVVDCTAPDVAGPGWKLLREGALPERELRAAVERGPHAEVEPEPRAAVEREPNERMEPTPR